MKPMLQVVAIALGLGVVAAAANGRLAAWFAGHGEERLAGAVTASASPATTETGRCLDEAEMRHVIREELAASVAATVPAQGSPAPGPADALPARRAAMQKLVRALKSGGLDGRL
jgi:hypothetical protein